MFPAGSLLVAPWAWAPSEWEGPWGAGRERQQRRALGWAAASGRGRRDLLHSLAWEAVGGCGVMERALRWEAIGGAHIQEVNSQCISWGSADCFQ